MESTFILLSIGNAVFVGAGLVTDAVRFRFATVIGSSILAIWGLVRADWGVVGWNLAFVLVNSVQTVRIMRDRAIKLDDDDERIRQAYFPSLSPRDFLTLWTAGRAESIDADVALCVEGQQQEDILLVLEGASRVTNESGLDIELASPTFVGEISFLTGEEASANVITTEPSRVRRWNQEDLHNLATLNPTCAQAWQLALGVDVAAKLRSS
ncbi:MAG: cyclic nucleotide-binding domain-containing protein [Ilumatobacter sp.]